MAKPSKVPFLCRFGLHSWVYVSSTTAPWWATQQTRDKQSYKAFRGCKRCRLEQISHFPVGSLDGCDGHSSFKWTKLTIFDLLKIYYSDVEIREFTAAQLRCDSSRRGMKAYWSALVSFYLDGINRKQ